MKVRVLIVDDEPPARRKLARLLEANEEVDVVGQAGDGAAAVEAIKTLSPDLVFLDVEMPRMNGLGVVEAIGAHAMPAVVFVTAYQQFAVDAFEIEAVDYLLKPYTRMRFERALSRGVAHVRRGWRDEASDPPPPQPAPSSGPLTRLVVHEQGRIRFVAVADVLYFKSSGNYVEAHTGETYHLVRETTSRLLEWLDPEKFARIHRSSVVNLEAVVEMVPTSSGDYDVVLRNGVSLRMSRRYASGLLKHR